MTLKELTVHHIIDYAILLLYAIHPLNSCQTFMLHFYLLFNINRRFI